jgi:hypothetical protein
MNKLVVLGMYALFVCLPFQGENKSEYFLGLTPSGVVVYKNKKQVGKYFW